MSEATRVSGIVLAAGLAQRFGALKQLVEIDGRPLVRHAVGCACASRLSEVLVVVGHEAPAVAEALRGLSVQVVLNAEYRDGQSTSVRAGLEFVAAASAGAMFLPADQPGLTPGVVDALVGAFERQPEAIVVPVYGGTRGAPVIFPRELFPALAGLRGDSGGRALLDRHAARLLAVPFDSTRALVDVDTVDDLDRWKSSAPQ